MLEERTPETPICDARAYMQVENAIAILRSYSPNGE